MLISAGQPGRPLQFASLCKVFRFCFSEFKIVPGPMQSESLKFGNQNMRLRNFWKLPIPRLVVGVRKRYFDSLYHRFENILRSFYDHTLIKSRRVIESFKSSLRWRTTQPIDFISLECFNCRSYITTPDIAFTKVKK